MIVTISGLHGTGKSTIGKLVAHKLGIKYYSTGQAFRDLAKEMNLTLEEFSEHAENNSEIDNKLDNKIDEIAQKGNIIIDSQLSAYFLKSIADLKQMYTQYGGIRPWGCALFFIGIDATGPSIYTTSPSGIYRSFKAYAIGSGETCARDYITENYKADMTFDELINLTLNSLKGCIDEDLSKDALRIGYIKSEDKKFKLCSKEEIDGFLKALK